MGIQVTNPIDRIRRSSGKVQVNSDGTVTVTGLFKGGTGDDFTRLADAAQPGRLFQFIEGTAVSPITGIGPTIKASKYVAVTQATIDAAGPDGNDGSDLMSAVHGQVFGTAACEVQPIGVYGSATTVSTTGHPGNDACAMYGTAWVGGSGTGRAIGAFFFASRNSAEATAGTSGVEVVSSNQSGTDTDYDPSDSTDTMGMWVNAYGVKRSGAGLVFGNAFGQQFDVGIGIPAISAGGFASGIRTSVIRDDGTSTNFVDVRGTKSGAILDFHAATLSGSCVGILAGNGDVIVASRDAADSATLNGLHLDGSNLWQVANGVMTLDPTNASAGIGTNPGTNGRLVVGGTVTDPGLGVFYMASQLDLSTNFKALASFQSSIRPTAALTHVYGMSFVPTLIGTEGASTNTVTNMHGIFARIDTNANYDAAITTAYGIYSGTPSHSGGGTITNYYGFYSDLNTGIARITNIFALNMAGSAPSNFGGNVQFGAHALWNSDNASDIGASGATRPRTGYFGTALAIGTNPASAGAVRVANAAWIASRNAANSADLNLVQADSSNRLSLLNGAALLDGTSRLTLASGYGFAFTGIAGDIASAAAGDHWYNTTQKSHRFQSTVAAAGLVGLIYASTADDAIASGGVAEVKFASQIALAAAGLTVGKIIRVRLSGSYTTDATASQTAVVNIKLGDATNATTGTTVATTRFPLTSGLTAAGWTIDADITIRSATTAWGEGTANVGSTVAAPWTSATAHVSNGGGVNTVTTIPNISGAQTVHVTWTPNDTGQTGTIRTMTVEILN